MIRTRVGFSGGDKPSPTYHDIGDHSETIEIDFDPAVISYEQLLEQFWHQHDASRPAFMRQYRSAIFYKNDEQKQKAEQSRAAWEKANGFRVSTAIEPARAFYLAEDYHQKYYLTHDAVLIRELRSIYPDIHDFVDSTVVARLEGLAGGYGLPHDGGSADAAGPLSDEELKAYGLSDEATAHVKELLKNARKPIRCGG